MARRKICKQDYDPTLAAWRRAVRMKAGFLGLLLVFIAVHAWPD